jgi:hypothetical protein
MTINTGTAMRSAVATLIVIGAALSNGTAVSQRAAVPVLVELFTAEGCSSCPPADTLLERMIETQPAGGAEIVGLGEHVDYWDGRGWKDRFSSAAMTARQQQYAARASSNDLYTPQMVVDGRDVFVGSDVNAARRAIERAVDASHGIVHLEAGTQSADVVALSIAVSDLPASSAGDRADIYVAVTEDRLRTDVKRGENHGRTLTHSAVVRELRTIGEVRGGVASVRTNIKLSPEWRRDHLKIVAFVQERDSRRVLATAATALTNGRE